MAIDYLDFDRVLNYKEPFTIQRIFADYHSRLVCVFADLPPENKVREIALRITAVVFSPILYPLLAVFDQISRLFYNPAAPLKQRIDWLKKHRPPEWQKIAIKLIRKSRHENPSYELDRLKNMGVLNHRCTAKLDEALGQVMTKNPSREKTLTAKMLIGQALEIKDIYHDTHDVFIHAQAGKWTIFSHLIKEFTKKFNPEADISHFKFLRAPCDTIDPGFLDSCWNFFFGKPSIPESVEDFVKSKWWINDDDPKDREMLVSADGYFYNHQTFESSLFFLINNDNIFNNGDAIKNFSKKVIKHFCPSLNDEAYLEKLANRITEAAFKKAECGNLFVICIPKDDSFKSQYRAHPYGSVCKCHHKALNETILRKLQESEVIDHATSCKTGFKIPQFRLYTPKLRPDGKKAIYLLTPFSKKVRKSIKDPVKKVVEIVYAENQNDIENKNGTAGG